VLPFVGRVLGIVGPRSPHVRAPSFPVGPIIGSASMMSKCNHPKFVATDVVDDAEGKLPQREAPSRASPGCAKLRMIAKDSKRAFDLGDKRAAEFCPTFARVEDRFFC